MSDAGRDSGFGIRGSGLGTRESRGTVPVDLEIVIDAVAREMTEAEPSGALRARVLDEIERQPGRPDRALPRWAWAGAAAVLLAAVASSVWLVRPAPQPAGEGPGTVAQKPAAERPSATPEAGQASPSVASSSTVAPSVRQVAVRPAAQGAEDASPDLHHVPALAEIEPLRFAAVEPAALRVESLEIASLTAIPSIEIPSLESGSRDIQSADPKKENRP